MFRHIKKISEAAFGSQRPKKISTDSWDDVLHDLIIYVSRSGKFTAFYIPYISHIVEMIYTDHTVISDISSIWGGIHKTTSS